MNTVYHFTYLGIVSFFSTVTYNFMCLEVLHIIRLFLHIWFLCNYKCIIYSFKFSVYYFPHSPYVVGKAALGKDNEAYNKESK